jgi:DNA-binding response OmpR family regulator
MATVLLVDDDPRTRDVLKRRLLVEGYQVVEAGDAAAALQRFHETTPDFVVADLRLPGASGDQLIGDLRTVHGSTRIIAISGAPERLAALSAMESPIRTLVKPFTSEQLLEALGGAMTDSAPWSPLAWIRRLLRV